MPFKKKYHCLEDVLQNTERTASGCMLWKGGMHRTGYPACSAYGETYAALAHKYGVAEVTIWRVLTEQNWRS